MKMISKVYLPSRVCACLTAESRHRSVEHIFTPFDIFAMLLYLARIIHTYTCRLRGSIIVASSYFQFVVTVSLFLANYAFVQRGSRSLSSDAFLLRKLNK